MSARKRTVSRPSIDAQCQGCDWTSTAANAVGNAAQHHDRTGHRVAVSVSRLIVYGDQAGAPSFGGEQTIALVLNDT